MLKVKVPFIKDFKQQTWAGGQAGGRAYSHVTPKICLRDR